MAVYETFDITHPQQDITGAYIALVKQRPNILSYFEFVNGTTNGVSHKWFEEQLTQTTTTIASFDSDGDGTGVNLVATAGMAVGDLLYFKSTTGQTRTEVCQIVTVDSATDLTLLRDYGSSTGVTLVVGDVVILKPGIAENASASATATTQPTEFTNYTTLVDKSYQITRSAMLTPVEALNNGNPPAMMTDAMIKKLLEIHRIQENDLFFGYKKVRATGAASKGSAGGLHQFTDSGNIITTGGAITPTHINDALQEIYDDGGDPNDSRILVCAPNQGRRISAFNTSGTNPQVTVEQASTTTGNVVTKFVGDIPGFSMPIVLSNTIPKDMVYVLQPDLIKVNFHIPLLESDATDPSDAALTKTRRIVGEYTFEIKNGKTLHSRISGLTV